MTINPMETLDELFYPLAETAYISTETDPEIIAVGGFCLGDQVEVAMGHTAEGTYARLQRTVVARYVGEIIVLPGTQFGIFPNTNNVYTNPNFLIRPLSGIRTVSQLVKVPGGKGLKFRKNITTELITPLAILSIHLEEDEVRAGSVKVPSSTDISTITMKHHVRRS